MAWRAIFAIDDAIVAVHDYWPENWHNAMDSTVGSSKNATQCKKGEAKLKVEQLAEKVRKEANDRAKAEQAATQKLGWQAREEECGYDEG